MSIKNLKTLLHRHWVLVLWVGLFVVSFTVTTGIMTWRNRALLKTTGLAGATVEGRIRSMGLAMWYWQIPRCDCDCPKNRRGQHRSWNAKGRGRHYVSVASNARRSGVKTAYVKVHDGTQPYASYDDGQITAFRKAGLAVLVWGYNHVNTPHAEAELIISYLHRTDVAGYIANTEVHVKGKAKSLETMMGRVRQHRDSCLSCRDKLIGYAPYAFPSYHRALSYEVLNRYSDFVAPQLYWATIYRHPTYIVRDPKIGRHKSVSRVVKAVSKMYAEWSAWEAQQERTGKSRAIPICPIGQTYGRVRPGEIQEFIRLTRGYYSISFWDAQHATPGMVRDVTAGTRRWRR